MNTIFLRLILISAFLQLGFYSKDFDLSSVSSLKSLRQTSLQVLKIDWKPISAFPEEARRFRKNAKH